MRVVAAGPVRAGEGVGVDGDTSEGDAMNQGIWRGLDWLRH